MPLIKPKNAKLVLSCSFDKGDADDLSGNKHNGTIQGAQPATGKVNRGMHFRNRGGNRGGGSLVKPHWTQDVPILVRAMLKAANTLFIIGPPDLIDEEKTFERIMARDPKVQAKLAQQNAALEGKMGARLLAVSAKDGSTIAELKLPSLPVWDSLAAANGRLYLSTVDGNVVCLAANR